MASSPRASAYACGLIIKDRKILLGRRAHFRAAYPRCWDVIGGKIEAGETPEQALTRELGEEIAITPQDPIFVEKISDLHMDAATPPVYHLYLVTAWHGDGPVMHNHEHSHLEWFTLQQARDLSNLALKEYLPVFETVLDNG